MGGDVGTFLNDVLTIGTMGIVDAKKGRVYVPFSGASARAGARAIAGTNADIASGLGIVDHDKARRKINAAIDSPEGRVAGQTAATLSALGTGYGVGAGVGTAVGGATGATTGATLGAAAAGGAAQTINQAEAESYKYSQIQSAEDAQRAAQQEFEKSAREAEKAAREAKLAVQTREAEDRRRRASKRVNTVLTSQSGLGGTPTTYTPTLQSRKSVLG